MVCGGVFLQHLFTPNRWNPLIRTSNPTGHPENHLKKVFHQKKRRIIDQNPWPIYPFPNFHALVIREIPRNCHIFALLDSPPQVWVLYCNDPGFKPFEDQKIHFPLSRIAKSPFFPHFGSRHCWAVDWPTYVTYQGSVPVGLIPGACHCGSQKSVNLHTNLSVLAQDCLTSDGPTFWKENSWSTCQKLGGDFMWVMKKTWGPLLSIESGLFNRNPYNSLSSSPHNWVVFHPPYTLFNQVFSLLMLISSLVHMCFPFWFGECISTSWSTDDFFCCYQKSCKTEKL